MKKFVITAVAAALLPLSSVAMAKDICLYGPDLGYVIFKKVKSLKPAKAAKVVPLTGIVLTVGLSAAVTGSAVVLANGTINYGWSAYTMGSGTNNLDLVVWGANALLEGSGYYDNDGDMLGNAPVSFTTVDCKILPAI